MECKKYLYVLGGMLDMKFNYNLEIDNILNNIPIKPDNSLAIAMYLFIICCQYS